jgi:septal ring factor EnvC (AmiA/AmiB activator)
MNQETSNVKSGAAVACSAVVRPHPWKIQFANKQKLEAARKERDRRRWRKCKAAERADETYNAVLTERSHMRSNAELSDRR